MSSNIITVSDDEFYKFQDFIEKKIGIKFPEAKKSLLESRLALHIKKRGFDSFGDYFIHISTGSDAEEFNFFVDKVTTHTTYFFREKEQFDYLISEGITLINKIFSSPSMIKVMSLGSSTGEEMYTLGMIFSELCNSGTMSAFEIHAADVSKKALLQAKTGKFDLKHYESLESKYKKYFKVNNDFIESKTNLKKSLRFFLLNGAKANQDFPDKYHVIFCRNTLIYFNKKMQQNFIDNIYNNLLPGGFMFLGHSESLNGIDHKFKRVKSSTFMKERS